MAVSAVQIVVLYPCRFPQDVGRAKQLRGYVLIGISCRRVHRCAMLTDPPVWYLPPCGLTNCLSSTSLSEDDKVATLSLLSDRGAVVLNRPTCPPQPLHSTPTSPGPRASPAGCANVCDSDPTVAAPSEKDFLLCADSAHSRKSCSDGEPSDALVHGTGHGGFLIRGTSSFVSLMGDCGRKERRRWSYRLGSSPIDASCAHVDGIGVICAVAARDGVSLFLALDSSESRGPEYLPGSEAHFTVAVDVSSSGFIAAATIYGRVAIWRCRSAPPAYVGFADTVTFDPDLKTPMHDRITQVLFSPAAASTLLLTVAWWSGRVVMYAFDARWALMWSHECPSDPVETFGTCPGTYLAYSGDASVLAVASGHGVLTFLSTDGGYVVGSVKLGTNDLGARKFEHVKGCASVGEEVLTVLRGSRKLTSTTFPTSDTVAVAVRRAREREREALCPELTLCDKATVRLSFASKSKMLEHRGGNARKLRKIMLPLDAGAVALVDDGPPEKPVPGCLYLTACAASSSYLALVMKSLVLVHFVKKKSWSAIMSPTDVSRCALGKILQGTPTTTQYLILCYSLCEQSVRFWDLETLALFSERQEPLQLAGIVEDVTGCSAGSGRFACLTREKSTATLDADGSSISDGDTLNFVFFEHSSGSYASRSFEMSERGLLTSLDNASFPRSALHVQFYGFWCHGGEAVICLSFSQNVFVALVIVLDGDVLRVSCSGLRVCNDDQGCNKPSSFESARSIATSQSAVD